MCVCECGFVICVAITRNLIKSMTVNDNNYILCGIFICKMSVHFVVLHRFECVVTVQTVQKLGRETFSCLENFFCIRFTIKENLTSDIYILFIGVIYEILILFHFCVLSVKTLNRYQIPLSFLNGIK